MRSAYFKDTFHCLVNHFHMQSYQSGWLVIVTSILIFIGVQFHPLFRVASTTVSSALRFFFGLGAFGLVFV